MKEWKTKSSNNELPPSKPSNIAPDSTARIVLSSRLSLPPIYINSNGIEEELDREDLKGPLLLNLWTSWCAPCVAELTEWTKSESTIREKGLRILALNVEENAESGIKKIKRKTNFPFEIKSGTTKTVRNLDFFQRSQLDRWLPMPVPSSFLIDKFGRVAVIYKGPVAIDQLMKDVELLETEPNIWRDFSVPFDGKWIGSHPSSDPLKVNSQFVDHNEIDEGLKYLERHVSIVEKVPNEDPIDLADIYLVVGVMLKEKQKLNKNEIYKEMVEVMDEGVGEIINTLIELDLEKKTIIFFFSDNGGTRSGNNGQLRGFKGGLYEGGHRVTSLVWSPSLIKSRQKSNETLMTMDILPTIAELMGGNIPNDIDGLSFKNHLMIDSK